MEFSFRVVGVGWAEAALRIDGEDLPLTASYLGDALGDLLRAVLRIVDGAETATCIWEEEPGQYLWEFHRRGDGIALRISGSDFYDQDQEDDEEDPRNRLLLEQEVSVADLCTAVVRGVDALLKVLTVAKYQKKWMHPFPANELARMRDLGPGVT